MIRKFVSFVRRLFAKKHTREELKEMSRKGLVPPIHHNCRCVMGDGNHYDDDCDDEIF